MHAYRLLALIVVFAFHAPSSGQEVKGKELKGTIRQIDARTGAVTLKPILSTMPRELNLASKDVPVVNALGQPLNIADLCAGLRIAAKLRNDEEISAIRVEGPYLFGTIRSLDPAKRTFVVTDIFGDRVVAIPAEVKILVNDKEASLADCKSGVPVQILFALDKKTVLQVQSSKTTLTRDPYLRLVRAGGFLVDLDAQKRSVRIVQQSLDYGIVHSFDVSEDAYFRLMHKFEPIKEVGLADLVKWTKVAYAVDRDTGKLVSIDADLPFLARRRVVKLDTKAQKITITEKGIEQILDLDAEVHVRTARGIGKLADVVENSIVTCILTPDRSKVMRLHLWDH